MGEPRKFYSSETIGERDVATTTRGIRRTNQVHRTVIRRPSIYVIHICIRERLGRIVDGRYRGPQAHGMVARLDPIGQSVTNKVEKPKVTLSISDLEIPVLLLVWIVL